MSETTIENKVCEYAKQLGWKVYKFKSPGNRGVADRIFLKNERTFFIEFKTSIGVTSKLQHIFCRDVAEQGFSSYFIDTINDGKKVVDMEDAETLR